MTITGVTPNGEQVTVGVEPYLDQIKSRIVTFVDLTNKVLDFLNKQNERGPDGKPVKDALLAGNNFLRDLTHKIRSSINMIVPGIQSGELQSLQDLGISFKKDEDGFHLKLDDSQLNKALNTNPDQVKQVLAFRFQTTNSSFLMPTSPQALDGGLGGKNIGVSVTNQGGVISAYYTLNTVNYPANIDSKGTITPQDGTPLSSLSPIYLMPSVYNSLSVGDTQSTTITITQGILDVLGNSLKGVVQKGLSVGGKTLVQAGSYENEDKRIGDDIQKDEIKIEKINEKAEREREKILRQFERMQGILEMAKHMRAMIASYFAAQNKQN
ncbi:Flagellar filament capping protein FliD [Candidatus Bealeia paramacronuclearis]|uniref:Flagellar filament capping protein FliD n=1 Tax=Candidatus Bealeia paramacronuclearis TaxID=1921001 RepID=A0ABZ2C5G2_9PROT|nr:Flagellar filament capping protein FliD [Candidatus Bealeia paramacronuclearis]